MNEENDRVFHHNNKKRKIPTYRPNFFYLRYRKHASFFWPNSNNNTFCYHTGSLNKNKTIFSGRSGLNPFVFCDQTNMTPPHFQTPENRGVIFNGGRGFILDLGLMRKLAVLETTLTKLGRRDGFGITERFALVHKVE